MVALHDIVSTSRRRSLGTSREERGGWWGWSPWNHDNGDGDDSFCCAARSSVFSLSCLFGGGGSGAPRFHY